jgi:hypothetical protein
MVGKYQQRIVRLQVSFTADEVAAIDEFRFCRRLPTRAAAARELLRRGLISTKGKPRRNLQSRIKEVRADVGFSLFHKK